MEEEYINLLYEVSDLEFNEVLEGLEEKRKEAVGEKRWVHLALASTGNLHIKLSIAPSGQPFLTVSTAKPTNALVFPSLEYLEELCRLVCNFINDSKSEKLKHVVEAIGKFMEKYLGGGRRVGSIMESIGSIKKR